MSFFGIKGASAIKPAAQKFRSEKVAVKSPSAALPRNNSNSPRSSLSTARSNSQSPAPSALSRSHKSSAAAVKRDDSSSRLKPRGHAPVRKRSPVQRIVYDESSDDEDEDRASGTDYSLDDFARAKRQKRDVSRPLDLNRRIRPKRSFGEEDARVLVHAADVACGARKFRPSLDAGNKEDLGIRLQYPGTAHSERYELVFLKDQLDPVEEICHVVECFKDFYLTPEQAKPFNDENTGILRRLERARNMKSIVDFKAAVDTYNAELRTLRKSGALAENIEQRHSLPFNLIRCIVTQVYERVVSPKVDSLKKYENGTDNVYGELLPPFSSRIFAETELTSDKVFVDLGSGVGNVVLQAALEVGCESWGCEMMENAYTLADAQQREFEARCRLWGIKPGRIRLEHGDFMENRKITEVLRRADVVLVNNQAFTPKLNSDLIHLFLELKDGCKVVSLKSFGSTDKITSYNENAMSNILVDIQQKEYFSKNVSWTDSSGTYFIATKDTRRMGGL